MLGRINTEEIRRLLAKSQIGSKATIHTDFRREQISTVLLK
jgi:hypothetical protein